MQPLTPSPQAPEAATAQRAQDKAGALITCALLAAVVGARAWLGHIPHDLSAYIYAADLFEQGLNPYNAQRFLSPFYQGYPYVYMPFTRWPLMALTTVPPLGWSLIGGALRLLTLAFLARTLTWRFKLKADWPMVMLAMLVAHPIFIDALTGNLATYMFAIVIALDAYIKRYAPSARPVTSLGLGFGAGLLLMVKFTWMLPALMISVGARQRALSAGLGAAALCALSLSKLHDTLFDSWLAMVARIAWRWPRADVLSRSPALYLTICAAWGVVALLVLRRGQRSQLLAWAGASVIVWPRQSEYDFMLFIPALLLMSARLKRWQLALCAVPALAPLPWALSNAGLKPLGLEPLILWGLLMSALLARYILSTPSDAPAP